MRDQVARGHNKCSASSARVTRAPGQMMFSDGFYNADPHPGNFLVSLAPQTLHQPVLLDFGLTTSLTPELRRALAKLVCSGGT